MTRTTPTSPPAAGLGLGGRPKGVLSAKPTAKQVNGYRRDLHAQARAGDTLALIGVVLIDTLERQHSEGRA